MKNYSLWEKCTIIFWLAFSVFVLYGAATQCPDLADSIYISCAKH